jgi:TRAP-type mannitol/chloroaromatic compound transport system permease small subunit
MNLKKNFSLISLIIEEFYSSTREHLHLIKVVFYLAAMSSHVKIFIRQYDICQNHKAETTRPAGLLQLWPIPSQIWVDISMGFIDGLPKGKW